MSATARPDLPEELRKLAGYGPFAVLSSSSPKIIDRDGRPCFFVVSATSNPAEAMDLAEAAALAMNDGLGFPRPSIEAPLDPRHLKAASQTSRPLPSWISPSAPLSDAAE